MVKQFLESKMKSSKSSVSFFLISCCFHAGIFIGIPDIPHTLTPQPKENIIEVEYYEMPKIMVRAKDSKAKKADAFSDKSESSKSSSSSTQSEEAIADKKAQDLAKQAYDAGMDLPSYTDMVQQMISFYLHKTIELDGKKLKVKIEFTISSTGALLNVNIPYGYESASPDFDLDVLNAVTLASSFFPPLPECVSKSQQNFFVYIMK